MAGREGGPRPRRLARGRAARPAAGRRGHHGDHQVRAGEDRPRAVHRRRRLPRRQALGPDPRAAGPLPDPRRARAADARTTSCASSPSRRTRSPSSTRRCSRPRASTLEFTADAVRRDRAARRRGQLAHREHRRAAADTLMEKLLEEVSFEAPHMAGVQLTVDGGYVRRALAGHRRGPGPQPLRLVACASRTHRSRAGGTRWQYRARGAVGEMAIAGRRAASQRLLLALGALALSPPAAARRATRCRRCG